jgi:uncharacterized protein YkwD
MPKHAHRPAVERLDARCLPSAGLSAGLRNGVLWVESTAANSRIVLNTVSLGRGPSKQFVVVPGAGRFPLGQIQTIQIDAGAGNDFISINVRKAGLTTRITTGTGNDVIYGTAGRDVIITGAGNSRIFGRGGNDQITPGPGRSIVNGRVVRIPAPPPATVSPPPPTNSTPPAASTTNPSGSTGYTLLPDPVPTLDVSTWVSTIATLTNQQRVENGLNSLTINPKLTAVAQIAVNQMLQTGVVSHEMNGTAYPSMQNRADAAGYTFYWLGENLAFGEPDPTSLVQAFMNSPAHRENMLFSAFTEMGIAVVQNQYGQAYVAIEFGQPK